jgi:hypothetical protein
MKSIKRNYNLDHRLMAYIFCMSLCLQSCAHIDNTPLPIQQKDDSPIYNEQLENPFERCPKEITAMILHRAAIDECLNNRSPVNILLVCKEWRTLIEEEFIDGKTVKQLCREAWYGVPEHEEIYERFLKGVLIYRPQKGSDVGMITLRISALVNPLDGTFDLSQCGDVGQYLTISTGYRKGKKAENANKLEIWLTPRFLVEKKIQGSAQHFQKLFHQILLPQILIQSQWPEKAPVGIFWTWGGWDNMRWYDHVTRNTIDELANDNLYKKWLAGQRLINLPHVISSLGDLRRNVQDSFHVHFMN